MKIVEEYHDRATTPIREQPRGEMPEPLVPEIVNSPIRLEQEVVSSDFSDLVNWYVNIKIFFVNSKNS